MAVGATQYAPTLGSELNGTWVARGSDGYDNKVEVYGAATNNPTSISRRNFFQNGTAVTIPVTSTTAINQPWTGFALGTTAVTNGNTAYYHTLLGGTGVYASVRVANNSGTGAVKTMLNLV